MIYELITDENGIPTLNRDGRFQYKSIVQPDWKSFADDFTSNSEWINYGSGVPLFASRLETFIYQDNPDVDAINDLLQTMFESSQPSNSDKQIWQGICDMYITNIIIP